MFNCPFLSDPRFGCLLHLVVPCYYIKIKNLGAKCPVWGPLNILCVMYFSLPICIPLSIHNFKIEYCTLLIGPKHTYLYLGPRALFLCTLLFFTFFFKVLFWWLIHVPYLISNKWKFKTLSFKAFFFNRRVHSGPLL